MYRYYYRYTFGVFCMYASSLRTIWEWYILSNCVVTQILVCFGGYYCICTLLRIFFFFFLMTIILYLNLIWFWECINSGHSLWILCIYSVCILSALFMRFNEVMRYSYNKTWLLVSVLFSVLICIDTHDMIWCLTPISSRCLRCSCRLFMRFILGAHNFGVYIGCLGDFLAPILPLECLYCDLILKFGCEP